MTLNSKRKEIQEEIARLESKLERLPEQWEPSGGICHVTAAGRIVSDPLKSQINRGASCNTVEAADRRIELITAVMRLDRWVEENGERGDYTVGKSAGGIWSTKFCNSPLEVPMTDDTAGLAAKALNDGTLVLHVESEDKFKTRPIEFGDYVAFAYRLIDVRNDKDCQKLTAINRHDDENNSYQVANYNLWWKYVKRWSDGAIFGPGGEIVEYAGRIRR